MAVGRTVLRGRRGAEARHQALHTVWQASVRVSVGDGDGGTCFCLLAFPPSLGVQRRFALCVLIHPLTWFAAALTASCV